MTVLQGIVLGIVQGLAEFLPISSSGHLMLIRNMFGLSDTTGAYMMFDILMHVGTLLVVLIVFWKDWWEILKNPFKSKTLLYLFVASLPALTAVVLFDDAIDYLSTGKFLGLSFIITGIILLIAQKFSEKQNYDKNLGLKHSLFMGFSQILGLLPGISRSGSTIFGGLCAKLDKKRAAKFSFMMSAPAIFGSLVYEGKKAITNSYIDQIELLPTLCGMVAAAICGYLAIKFMLNLINKISLSWFALYVVLLGIAVIIMQSCGIFNLEAMPKLFGFNMHL